MEQREIILRQKLGKHGYKLKGANKRFFVKGTYTDKYYSSTLCQSIMMYSIRRNTTEPCSFIGQL